MVGHVLTARQSVCPLCESTAHDAPWGVVVPVVASLVDASVAAVELVELDVPVSMMSAMPQPSAPAVATAESVRIKARARIAQDPAPVVVSGPSSE